MDYKEIPFSVLMTTYIDENAENLGASLNSILVDQTVIPSQVVLVLDGPIKEDSRKVVNNYKSGFPDILEVIECEKNRGQSKASAEGLQYVKYELIARMDSDDISVRTRFEKELEVFDRCPEVDVVGGWIEEFKENPGDLSRLREVPQNDPDIKNMFRNRMPVNNVTSMIRKEALLNAGGYGRNTVNEDYSLYCHMWVCGSRFYNLQEVLVHVRVGNGMTARRKDFRIFTDWCKDQRYLYKNRKHSVMTALVSCVKCFGFVIMPNKLKEFVYSHFLRRKGRS